MSQIIFEELKDCHSCYHFNRDLSTTKEGNTDGYSPNFCYKFKAFVPKDFQEEGCQEWDTIPF